MQCLQLQYIGSLFCILLVLPTWGHADDIRLLGDWTYSIINTETEDRDTETSTKGETIRFQETYRLDINKQLFPTLNINTGAQVEENNIDTESEGVETDTSSQEILPYIDAEWRNLIYSLSGGYRERYAKRTGSGFAGEDRDYLTSYNLRGEWRPVELPQFELNYLHSERTDDPRTRDNETDIFQLNTRYDYRQYEFRYSYMQSQDTNHINATETNTRTHNGRVRYADSFMDDRLTLNAGIRAEYSNQEFSGSGERDFAVFPSGAGFFFIDSDPLPNNNNPDDYRSEDFADSLDLNSNDILDIGLDFGEPVVTDKVQLRINSDDSIDTASNITDNANWAVYVSQDQETWQARSNISVEYLIDENLIEISFAPSSNHDYLMAVYNPPVVTNQTGPVRITSIRAFISRQLDDGSVLRTMTHQLQLGLGYIVSPKTRTSYSFNLQDRRSSLFDETNTRVSNSINIIHLFNDVFTGTARLSADKTWENGYHDTSSYSWSGRLSARYLETLSQSLIYSGLLTREDEGDDLSNSLILRTNAEMYQGWDLSFDQGVSHQQLADDSETTNVFLRLQNSFVPHESYNLVADYSINWEKTSSEDFSRSDTGRLRGFWVPRDTISLGGEVLLRKSEDGDTDISWEYTASWLPLRDGTLQCSLNYYEEEDQDGNKSWSFSPNIIWEMTHYATLSLRYSRGERETDDEINDFETAQLNLRMFYD